MSRPEEGTPLPPAATPSAAPVSAPASTLAPPAGPPRAFLARFLTFIRFSHTVFALPFALGAMLVASRARPGWRLVGLILAAMVFARTAGMIFNRVADWEIDQHNPRTAGRHRLLTRPTALWLLVASALAFVATTALINLPCLICSPLALAIVFFYSLTKRFTDYTQFFIGLALAVAPVGAWLAVTGHLAWPPLLLAAAVVCWVAGFDLIYATLDYDFDRRMGLRSLVVKLGVPGSLRAAQQLHLAAFGLLALFGWTAGLGWIYGLGMVLVLGAFFYEHRVAARQDVRAVNEAFFSANAFVSAVFVVTVWLDLVLR